MRHSAQKTWAWTGPAVACAIIALVAPTAQAAEPVDYNTFEITPFGGYMFGGEFEDPADDSERDLESDTAFGVIFDVAADSWRHYEFLYASQSTQVEGATPIDMDVQYLQIGGIVSYEEARRVIPYFGLTFGGAHFSPDAPGLDDETKVSFSAAGGVRIPITDHIGVRFDARAFITLLDTDDGQIFCVSSEGATCVIRAKGDTFAQYAASLGVTIAF
jgi:hypothetical protein